ncbi:MAG: transcriptional regulator GcvA [Rhodospirillum sp.]|nr:transcriptional regulator GcvA [Rhodospirillum sp.]
MVRRLPPLNALRAFEAAARHGGFTGAAKELNVTPAAVSHQVKGLEDFLGQVLFHRLARGLDLTEAGRSYLPELTAGFDQLARAADCLRGGDLAGRLVVSVLPSFCAGWLAPRIGGFNARHPEIRLELLSQNRNTDFETEDVDMGLRYGRGVYPGLEVVRVLDEEVFPICSPALMTGPLPLRGFEDLRHHVLLHDPSALPDEPWNLWSTWLDSAGVEGLDLDRGHGFSDTTAMIAACVSGLGVGIGRSALVREHLRAGRLVRPFTVSRPGDYAYWAAFLPKTRENPKAMAFLDWVLSIPGTASPSKLLREGKEP